MAHMRDKAITCPRCLKLCRFTANLDDGKITQSVMPPECTHPSKCSRKLIDGIFDRQFGQKLIHTVTL